MNYMSVVQRTLVKMPRIQLSYASLDSDTVFILELLNRQLDEISFL